MIQVALVAGEIRDKRLGASHEKQFGIWLSDLTEAGLDCITTLVVSRL